MPSCVCFRACLCFQELNLKHRCWEKRSREVGDSVWDQPYGSGRAKYDWAGLPDKVKATQGPEGPYSQGRP